MKLSELQQIINKLIEATGNGDPEVVFEDELSFEYYFLGVKVAHIANFETRKGILSLAPEGAQKLIFTVSKMRPNEESQVQE